MTVVSKPCSSIVAPITTPAVRARDARSSAACGRSRVAGGGSPRRTRSSQQLALHRAHRRRAGASPSSPCALHAPAATSTATRRPMRSPAGVAAGHARPAPCSDRTTSMPATQSPPACASAARSASTTARGSTWPSWGARIAPRDARREAGLERARGARVRATRTSSPSRAGRRAAAAAPRRRRGRRPPPGRPTPHSRWARPLCSSSSAAKPGHSARARGSAPAAPPRRSRPRSPARASPRPRPTRPHPGSSRSTTSTDSPACAARHAQARPIEPAPMTARS